jgi:adhesin/invasin
MFVTATTFRIVIVLVLFTIIGCGSGGNVTPIVYSVTLTADKSQAIASSTDNVTLTATVKDSNGFPLSGQPIRFNAPLGVSFTSPTKTDANGMAVISLSHPPVGPSGSVEQIVTATSGGVTSNGVAITFSNPPQTPASVALTVDKTSFSADGIDKLIFTITARDSNGLPLPGQIFAFDVNSGIHGPSLAGTGDSFTDSSGQAKMSLQSAARDTGVTASISISVTATISGVTSNIINVTVTPP